MEIPLSNKYQYNWHNLWQHPFTNDENRLCLKDLHICRDGTEAHEKEIVGDYYINGEFLKLGKLRNLCGISFTTTASTKSAAKPWKTVEHSTKILRRNTLVEAVPKSLNRSTFLKKNNNKGKKYNLCIKAYEKKGRD